MEPIGVGYKLGLRDSKDQEFQVGSIVRLETTVNKKVHGNWTEYVVKMQACIPVLSYLRSEKGAVLAEGYTGFALSLLYDQKLLVFTTSPFNLTPDDYVVIVEQPASCEGESGE